MEHQSDILLAAKCAPRPAILSHIEAAGIGAVELYTGMSYLHGMEAVVSLCRDFPFRYALHAPNDGHDPILLAELAARINAEAVVFHDVFWEDEWQEIVRIFSGLNIRICVENMGSAIDTIRVIRRFGCRRCLDLEHLQMECAGFFVEGFLPLVKQAGHVHLTGYTYGSQLWHTPIHYSPQHNMALLDLLHNAGYCGFVVSEGKVEYQTLEEFRRLKEFFSSWKDSRK